MAAAKTPPVPPGEPPSPGGNHSGKGNDRTMPEWMDRAGMFGQRIVLSLQPVGDGSLPRNPFVIGKSIERACGKIESANTEERGTKYVLKTRSAAQAKKLMQMTHLIDETPVQVIPHPTQNISRCVVFCLEAIDLGEKELLDELEPQGVTGVRRITKLDGNVRKNTGTLVLTISGTVVPQHIYFGPLRMATRLFYPKPMLCFKCCSYGHTKAKCKNDEVCQTCSLHHAVDTNEGGRCILDPYCKNCEGTHPPTSKKCPMYEKEDQIIKIKVETGVSFGEARKEYEKRNSSSSYVGVSGAQARLEEIQNNNKKDLEIQALKVEIEKLKQNTMETEKEDIITSLKTQLEQQRNLSNELMARLRNITKTQYQISEDSTEKETTEDDEPDKPQNKLSKTGKGQKVKLIDPLGSQTTTKRGRGRPRKDAAANAGRQDAEMNSL